jgi:hypothetical protein
VRLVNCRKYDMVTAVVGHSIGRAADPLRLEISVPGIPAGNLECSSVEGDFGLPG